MKNFPLPDKGFQAGIRRLQPAPQFQPLIILIPPPDRNFSGVWRVPGPLLIPRLHLLTRKSPPKAPQQVGSGSPCSEPDASWRRALEWRPPVGEGVARPRPALPGRCLPYRAGRWGCFGGEMAPTGRPGTCEWRRPCLRALCGPGCSSGARKCWWASGLLQSPMSPAAPPAIGPLKPAWPSMELLEPPPPPPAPRAPGPATAAPGSRAAGPPGAPRVRAAAAARRPPRATRRRLRGAPMTATGRGPAPLLPVVIQEAAGSRSRRFSSRSLQFPPWRPRISGGCCRSCRFTSSIRPPRSSTRPTFSDAGGQLLLAPGSVGRAEPGAGPGALLVFQRSGEFTN